MTLCQTETSCCTRAVEQRLGAWAERRYRDALQNKTNHLLAELDTRATQVDGEDSSDADFYINEDCNHCNVIVFADYIYVLLNKAQREFHEMFTRTYGTESMQKWSTITLICINLLTFKT